jgi:hypothetical protein
MKKIIISSFLISLCSSIHAQHFIGWSFSESHTGRNIHLLYGTEYKKLSIQIGLKYLLNNEPGTNDNKVTFQSSYATNFAEHIGISSQFRWQFNPKNWVITPSLFCHLQLTHASIKNFYFFPTSGFKNILTKVSADSEVFNSLEHGLGLRLDAPISTSAISIHAAIGVNAAYMWGFKPPLLLGTTSSWEVTPYFYSMGMSYHFFKEVPKNKLKKS